MSHNRSLFTFKFTTLETHLIEELLDELGTELVLSGPDWAGDAGEDGRPPRDVGPQQLPGQPFAGYEHWSVSPVHCMTLCSRY